MEVSEQYVHVGRGREAQAQGPDPGAGIEQQLLAAVQEELDRGRVAAVAVHLRSRCGNRAPGAPDPDLHALSAFCSSVGQNRIMAPEEPSSEATIGNALD